MLFTITFMFYYIKIIFIFLTSAFSRTHVPIERTGSYAPGSYSKSKDKISELSKIIRLYCTSAQTKMDMDVAIL